MQPIRNPPKDSFYTIEPYCYLQLGTKRITPYNRKDINELIDLASPITTYDANDPFIKETIDNYCGVNHAIASRGLSIRTDPVLLPILFEEGYQNNDRLLPAKLSVEAAEAAGRARSAVITKSFADWFLSNKREQSQELEEQVYGLLKQVYWRGYYA